jgi:hypothetical protein
MINKTFCFAQHGKETFNIMDNRWNVYQVHVNHQLSLLRFYHKITIIVIYFQVQIIIIIKKNDYNKNKNSNNHRTYLIQNQTKKTVQIQTNITNR